MSKHFDAMGAACAGLGGFGALLFACVALTMLAQAGARAVGLALVGGDEVAGWLSAGAAFCAFPYAFREGALIRMELILGRLSGPALRRAELMALLVGSAWCVAMAWTMGRFVWQNAAFGERSTGLINIPIWPVQVPAVAGLTLLALAMIEQLWRVWRGERPLYVVKAEQTLAGDDRHSAGL
jgi:TRAP-type C4-dicarboxylate transport system permease small subunit